LDGTSSNSDCGKYFNGFAIDAWWENRQEREQEQAVLTSLHRDFLQSRLNLDEALELFDIWKANFVRFQSSTPSELSEMGPAAAGLLLTGLSGGMTYDPTSGTLNALVSDGRLGLIEDLDLRDGLASWLRALQDLTENEADIRAGSLRVQIAMEPHGGPFQIPVPGPPVTLDHFALPTGATLSALRADPSFVGRARSHHYQTALYVRELQAVSKILATNLVTLRGLTSSSLDDESD
jgi:hypothetical protein